MGKISDVDDKSNLVASDILMLVLFKVPPIMIGMILVTIGRTQFKKSSSGYLSLLENWRRPALMEISVGNNGGCPDGYSRIFEGRWPGTRQGCNCLNVDSCSLEGVPVGGISGGGCNGNETECGCSGIPATPAVNMWVVPNDESYCGRLDPSLSYEKTFKNMHRSSECYDGYKKCGDIQGKSKGVCIPERTDCPITDIQLGGSNPDPGDYEEITGGQGSLFYSRSSGKHPLTDIKMAENGVCLSSLVQSLSPNRPSYLLRNVKGDSNCPKDPRYTKLQGDYGEMTLFNLNGVQYLNLPGFSTSDDFRWERVTRSLIEFSPACLDLVQDIFDGEETMNSISSNFGWALGMSITGLIVSLFVGITEVVMMCDAQLRNKFIFMGIRTTFLVLAMIPMVLLFTTSSSNLGFYKDIGTQQCSDSSTNQLFKDSEAAISKYAYKWQLISFLLILICHTIEYFIISFIICKILKKYSSGYEQHNDDRAQNYNETEGVTKMVDPMPAPVGPINPPNSGMVGNTRVLNPPIQPYNPGTGFIGGNPSLIQPNGGRTNGYNHQTPNGNFGAGTINRNTGEYNGDAKEMSNHLPPDQLRPSPKNNRQ